MAPGVVIKQPQQTSHFLPAALFIPPPPSLSLFSFHLCFWRRRLVRLWRSDSTTAAEGEHRLAPTLVGMRNTFQPIFPAQIVDSHATAFRVVYSQRIVFLRRVCTRARCSSLNAHRLPARALGRNARAIFCILALRPATHSKLGLLCDPTAFATESNFQNSHFVIIKLLKVARSNQLRPPIQCNISVAMNPDKGSQHGAGSGRID